MSQRIHVDANVILRFLRNDDPEQSPIAAALFDRAQSGQVKLLVSAVTVAEVFYVLASVYNLPRPETASILHTLLSSDLLACNDLEIVLDALKQITANKDSFGDAYLMATAGKTQDELASFDKGITSRKNIRVYPLASLQKAKGK